MNKTVLEMIDDARVTAGFRDVASVYLPAERMLRLCANALKKSPKLMQCDAQSVLGAMMLCQSLGLEPNTITQQAYLIPYRMRRMVAGQWRDVYECQFQIGYRGYIVLAHRDPDLVDLHAEAIHEGDTWEYMQGSEFFLRYAKTLADRGPLIGAYCYTRGKGGEAATVLPLSEIQKIRGVSESYRSLYTTVHEAKNTAERERAEASLRQTPWVLWEDEMAAKSAIKRHVKQMPLGVMAAAAALDDEMVALAPLADPAAVKAIVNDGMPAAVTEAAAEADAQGAEVPHEKILEMRDELKRKS